MEEVLHGSGIFATFAADKAPPQSPRREEGWEEVRAFSNENQAPVPSRLVGKKGREK